MSALNLVFLKAFMTSMACLMVIIGAGMSTTENDRAQYVLKIAATVFGGAALLSVVGFVWTI